MPTYLEERREKMLRKARKYLTYAEEISRVQALEGEPSVERAMLSALMSMLWLQAAELETQGVRLLEVVPD
jgi:hypothetical protein